jgi:transcriptional regulator NrdR family protein
MTFTEREKFIYHAATLMTMKIMSKEFNLAPFDVQKLMSLIKNNRCRQLSDKNLDEIYTDIEEEVLLANSVYDLRDNEVFTR